MPGNARSSRRKLRFEAMSFLPAVPALFATVFGFLIGTLMFVLSLFLILLILIQRGKGGGLAGALGGPGGQSAFGSKAGDTITMVTAGLAVVWGLVCAIAMYSLGESPTGSGDEFKPAEPVAQVNDPGQEGVEPGTLENILGGGDESSGGAIGDSEMTPAEDTGEAKPVAEETSTDDAEKPAEEKPAEEKPAEEKPAEEKPAEEKPAESTEAESTEG